MYETSALPFYISYPPERDTPNSVAVDTYQLLLIVEAENCMVKFEGKVLNVKAIERLGLE